MGAIVLSLLTGCTAYVDGPRAEVYTAPPVVVVQDSYIYYPAYDVYYNSYRREYAYMDRGRWVSRPEPRGVAVNVLLSSPSVRMNFHDAPGNHHDENVRQYPRGWHQPAPDKGRKQEQKDDRRDGHDAHHGR